MGSISLQKVQSFIFGALPHTHKKKSTKYAKYAVKIKETKLFKTTLGVDLTDFFGDMFIKKVSFIIDALPQMKKVPK